MTKKYAKYLIEWMKLSELTRQQVADGAGSNKSAIQRWRSGKSVPNTAYAISLHKLSGGAVPFYVADEEREALWVEVAAKKAIKKPPKVKPIKIAKPALIEAKKEIREMINQTLARDSWDFSNENIIEKQPVPKMSATIYNGEYYGGGAARLCEEA